MPGNVENHPSINTRSPKTRKSTQRRRLLAGMIAAAGRHGYAAANVSQVIAHAGVSRPTFYDYFANKDDCFLAAHRAIATRAVEEVRVAVADAPPERAMQAAVLRLLELAEAEPAAAHFLANETLAGGPRALDERDLTVRQIEEIVDLAAAATPPDTPSPDLPTRAAIGGFHWLLGPRLRRGEHDFSAMADELEAWLSSYNRPVRGQRWRKLTPGPLPGLSPHVSELPLRPPPPIPAGRSSLAANDVAQNQRLRILFATVEASARAGYSATTVADIAAAAQIDKRVFYSHFRDKQQAFLAVHELAFQQTMAIGASAFFSAESWPERMWQGIHAGSQFNATHPIARVIYLESHALGAPAIQRIDDSHAAFTIFLQEGTQHAASPPSRTAMEAVVAASFEIGYHQFRNHTPSLIPRFIHLSTYICLTPFLGAEAANEFLDGKLG